MSIALDKAGIELASNSPYNRDDPESILFPLPGIGKDIRRKVNYAYLRPQIFDVQLKECIDYFGFSFAGDAHPYVMYFNLYVQKGATHAVSYLRNFFKERQSSWWKLPYGRWVPPIRPDLCLRGWDFLAKKHLFSKYKNEGNENLMPDSEEMIEIQIMRLNTIYRSISQIGYKKDYLKDLRGYKALANGFIRGIWLKKGLSKKFVVIGGHHRVATLAATGQKSIPVITRPGLTNEINLNALANWQTCSKEELHRLLFPVFVARLHCGNIVSPKL